MTFTIHEELNHHMEGLLVDSLLETIEGFGLEREAVIEYTPYDAYTGIYRYKKIRHEGTAEQCILRVMFKDQSIQEWVASCDDTGHIVDVTTSEGKTLTTLAELRATRIVEAWLVSEYNIIDF